MTQEQNRNSVTPDALLRRKLLLGLAASYRKIGQRIGVSETSVRAALTQEQTGLPINRERILSDVAGVLDEIERERQAA